MMWTRLSVALLLGALLSMSGCTYPKPPSCDGLSRQPVNGPVVTGGS